MKQPDCSHYIEQVVEKGKAKLKVAADRAFISLYPDFEEANLDVVSSEIRKTIIEQSKEKFHAEPTNGALNRCSGLWHEMAFLYRAHPSILTHTKDLYIVKMADEKSLKFWEIYDDKSRKEFEDILLKLKENQIFIRCSTPDFVIIKRDVLQRIPDRNKLDSKKFYYQMKDLYKKIFHKCPASKVVGFVSLKTSNRPDRRYQIIHEANVTKYAAKYLHENCQRLRYDTIGKSSNSDKEVFNSPLMHELPRFSVDKLKKQIKKCESPIINSDTRIQTQKELDDYWSKFL